MLVLFCKKIEKYLPLLLSLLLKNGSETIADKFLMGSKSSWRPPVEITVHMDTKPPAHHDHHICRGKVAWMCQ
jgi:hypothetical protein